MPPSSGSAPTRRLPDRELRRGRGWSALWPPAPSPRSGACCSPCQPCGSRGTTSRWRPSASARSCARVRRGEAITGGNDGFTGASRSHRSGRLDVRHAADYWLVWGGARLALLAAHISSLAPRPRDEARSTDRGGRSGVRSRPRRASRCPAFYSRQDSPGSRGAVRRPSGSSRRRRSGSRRRSCSSPWWCSVGRARSRGRSPRRPLLTLIPFFDSVLPGLSKEAVASCRTGRATSTAW